MSCNEQSIQPPGPAMSVNDVLPASLDSFIGQEAVVAAVTVAIQASNNTGGPFPAALFCGPPGTGKSQLVQIISNELGVELHETLAQTLTSSSDLQALLLGAQDNEIVFLDEATNLPRIIRCCFTVRSQNASFSSRAATPRVRREHFRWRTSR